MRRRRIGAEPPAVGDFSLACGRWSPTAGGV